LKKPVAAIAAVTSSPDVAAVQPESISAESDASGETSTAQPE